MGDGGGQRVGGVGLGDAAGRQQPLDHELDLLLAGMTGADHAFLDLVGGVFGNLEPGLRRQRSSAQSAGALTASQRALNAAIGDRSILDAVPDPDFAAFEAASLRARG